MKLNNNAAIAQTSGIKNSMQFGIGDMSIVMEVLTRLYSNPKQTLTQEYICNGRDANRESKSKKPIEITLPTTLEPRLTIRDYGKGLSPKRIKEVFLLYGASTKRSTNGQTGGFGIGAKSAWAYTDSFNITSFYRGKKRTYVCHKSSGNGNMDMIEEIDSIEETGVKLEIAIKPSDITDFKNAVFRTIYFWDEKEKPIITNLTSNDNFEYAKLDEKISDNCFVVDKYYLPYFVKKNLGYNDTLIIIDGIPYPLSNRFFNDNKIYNKLTKVLNNSKLLFFAQNGELEIAPNREELIDNDFTRKTLNKFFIDNYKLIMDKIKNEFKKAKTVRQSIDIYKELNENYNVDGKFKDYEIINNHIFANHFSLKNKIDSVKSSYWNKRTDGVIPMRELIHNGKVDVRYLYSIPLNHLDCIYFNDSNDSILKINKKIRHHKISKMVLVDKKTAKDLNAKNISQLAEPPKVKKSKVKVNRGKKICLHRVGWGVSKNWLLVNEVKTNEIYCKISEKSKYNELMRYLDKNVSVCYIADSNVKYLNDKFIHIKDFMKTYKPNDEEITDYYSDIDFYDNIYKKLNNAGIKHSLINSATKISWGCNTPPDEIKNRIIGMKNFKKLIKKKLKLKNLIDDKLFMLKHTSNYYSNRFCSDSSNDIIKYVNQSLGGN